MKHLIIIALLTIATYGAATGFTSGNDLAYLGKAVFLACFFLAAVLFLYTRLGTTHHHMVRHHLAGHRHHPHTRL